MVLVDHAPSVVRSHMRPPEVEVLYFDSLPVDAGTPRYVVEALIRYCDQYGELPVEVHILGPGYQQLADSFEIRLWLRSHRDGVVQVFSETRTVVFAWN